MFNSNLMEVGDYLPKCYLVNNNKKQNGYISSVVVVSVVENVTVTAMTLLRSASIR